MHPGRYKFNQVQVFRSCTERNLAGIHRAIAHYLPNLHPAAPKLLNPLKINLIQL